MSSGGGGGEGGALGQKYAWMCVCAKLKDMDPFEALSESNE